MRADWRIVSLGDVAEIGAGNSAPQDKALFVDGIYPFVRTSDVGKVRFGTISDAADKLNDKGIFRLRKVSKGTVLVPKSGASTFLNHRVILADDCYVSSHLATVKAKPARADDRFLLYFLGTIKAQDLIQDHKYPSLKLGDISEIRIGLPSLAEQKRIVAILDEAFKGIETAIANIERNLANARELFESFLESVLDQGGKGWVETSLGDEVELLTGFAFKSNGYTNSESGVRLLRGDNIVQGGFRWEDVKRWPQKDIGVYKKFSLKAGDIVLAMDRTWVKAGLKYAQVTDNDLPCLLVQRVARIRARKDVDNKYLKFVIASVAFRRYVLAIQTGLGVPHISGSQIAAFRFNRPSIEKQVQISSRIIDFYNKTQCLESTYQRKLAALTELKQSVLRKAFSGELTAEAHCEEGRELAIA